MSKRQPQPRQAWAKAVEAETRSRQPERLREAQRAWKRLSVEAQLDVAKEVVDTRAAELCRAHKNVINVSYGYRARQDRRTGKKRRVKQICVTFLVRKKWKPSQKKNSDEELPKYLFAYCFVKGGRKQGKAQMERVLCAIPTDVECASDYYQVRPHVGTEKILVSQRKSRLTETGIITCALKRSAFPDKIYALSCRHVFALSSQMHPKVRFNAAVEVLSSHDLIGKTKRPMGELQDGPSFDAQLAEVSDTEALQQALKGLNFRNVAEGRSDIPENYWIHSPNGRRRADMKAFLANFPIDYGRRGIHSVRHELLIESLVTGVPTQPGDSGSPVSSTENGGVLLGMHIAGGGSIALMIPAWLLFEAKLYKGIANSETLTLINPRDL